MKNHIYRKYLSTVAGKNFVIEQDVPKVGWYLYVYEIGNCIADLDKKIVYESSSS
jgi:hypothetical protein